MNKISFTQDILKKVSDDNNIPLELVKYSFDIMLENLNDLVRNTDASSIFVPEIGTLYANYQKLNVFKNSSKVDKGLIQSKIDNIEKLIKLNKRNKNYSVNRHLQKPFLKNHFFSKGLSVEEIEQKQNETRK